MPLFLRAPFLISYFLLTASQESERVLNFQRPTANGVPQQTPSLWTFIEAHAVIIAAQVPYVGLGTWNLELERRRHRAIV
jgi:hypothetical protein